MTGPSTPLDLDAIRARYDKIKSGPPRLAGFNALRSARDVPDLLAEVERLRAELDHTRRRFTEPGHDQSPCRCCCITCGEEDAEVPHAPA